MSFGRTPRGAVCLGKPTLGRACRMRGDVLALINDDVTLDKDSLDAGLECLAKLPPTTLIGALLRTPDEKLQHAGFAFELNHNPYHILEGMIDADDVVKAWLTVRSCV